MRTGQRHGTAAALALAMGLVSFAWTPSARADGITDGNQGREALLSGNLDDAIRLFTQALTSGALVAKNQAVTLNLRANAYMEKGQTDVALDDVNESLRLSETSDARFTRAKIYIARLRFDDAVEDLNRAMQLGSQAADVWALRGHARLYAGHTAEAVKDLDQAIKLSPDYGFAWRTRGHAFMNLGQDDKAIADETRAIALDPKDVEAHWLRAYGWRHRKNQPAKAIADYTQALRVAPADSNARTSRAETYEEMGRFAEAAADYDVGIKQNPRGSSGYWGRGRMNVVQGKAGAGAADLAKAVSLKPADAYAVLWLHLARNKEGANDKMELQINAGRVDHARWPGPVLDYFTGKTDAVTLLTIAGDGEAQARTKQLCEANLFLGQDDLAGGRRTQGLERLQAAARVCEAVSDEARLIRTDLQRAGAAGKPVLTQAADRGGPATSKLMVQAQNRARNQALSEVQSAASSPSPRPRQRVRHAVAGGGATGGELPLRGSLK